MSPAGAWDADIDHADVKQLFTFHVPAGNVLLGTVNITERNKNTFSKIETNRNLTIPQK